MQCASAIIDPDKDDLTFGPSHFLKYFLLCKGSEFRSNMTIEKQETKKLLSSTGHVLSEKYSEMEKSGVFIPRKIHFAYLRILARKKTVS